MRASSAASASPRRFLMGPSSLLHFPSSSSIAPDAAASASLSALLPLPPLPSPYPSHVILYLQQIEHGAAAVDLVRKRPAPDLYLPPQWHATGDFSDVNAATGDFSDVMPSFPVAGPSKQRRKQRDQDLRTFVLLRCAESVNSDDLDEAPSALQEITKLATTFRTSTQRVAAYFAKAMPPRLVSSCHGICLYAPLPHASYPAASDLVNSRTAAAFEAFSVIVKLSHFKAKQPIQEAFEREGLGHILHIMIMLGLQWPGLVHILNSCSRGPPRVGLTVLGTFMEALEAAGQRPSVFADMLVLSFGFCPMAYAAGKLDLMKLGVGKRRLESVAVHWFHYSLYDVNANDSNTLCLVQRYKFTDLRESKSGMKWDLENHDGGVEEVSQKSPGLNTTPFGFVKYSNTYNPECIHETYQENTICDLDDKGEYELPKVWMGNREKHKKKEKVKAHLFTALKVTGIRNHTRYLLLIVLFCTLITTAGSSSRAERSGQGFCPKPDVIQFLLPPHEIVCPIVDISSTHWTHSKRAAPKTAQIWEGTCAIIVLIVSVVCIIGPWYSIYILQPVQGKVHKFLFFIKVEPVRMWYFTLAMSVNYYTSMIVYGIMLKSDQSCQIWAPNAIYCSIFLLLVAFLCYRERTIYQVSNMVLLLTCLSCIGGAGVIALLCKATADRFQAHILF